MQLTVDAGGGAQFATIGAAVAAVPEGTPATVFIKNGIYREKLYCEKAEITLVGESRAGTLLVYGDGAKHRAADGRPNGTFRSYTAFFSGGFVAVEHMTIANTAGDGRVHGQGIAVAVDAARARFRDVAMLGCQDTLFTGPLPDTERLPDGFRGPKQHAPRLPSRQYYEDCYIRGDIDFIFGGATALFERCTLHCRDRREAVNGYIAAPSTAREELGYVFHNCTVESASAAPGSFFLARPWRAFGAAAFLGCELGEAIAPAGFDNWGDAENEVSARFCEYGNTGPGACGPRAFGRVLTPEAARDLLARARVLCQSEPGNSCGMACQRDCGL